MARRDGLGTVTRKDVTTDTSIFSIILVIINDTIFKRVTAAREAAFDIAFTKEGNVFASFVDFDVDAAYVSFV
jgi:hypothetical protein